MESLIDALARISDQYYLPYLNATASSNMLVQVSPAWRFPRSFCSPSSSFKIVSCLSLPAASASKISSPSTDSDMSPISSESLSARLYLCRDNSWAD